ncbi:MAG: glycosyltransferase, partial [Methermicoccaceae archaeon]
MRLALLSPLEHGSKDAISTHTLQLVKHLTPMLQQTQLVVRRWSGEQLEGVKVQESGTFPIRSLGDVVGAFLTVLQLRKHVDIIYSRSPFLTLGAVLACGSTPLIYEVNGLVAQEQKLYGGLHRLVGWAAALADHISLKGASHVVAVTMGIKEALVEAGVPHEAITVIENGADIELFRPLEGAREALGLRSPVVGFVGSLAPWHGVEMLIEAAPLVLAQLPSTHFLIV